MSLLTRRTPARRALTLLAGVATATLVLTACSSTSESGDGPDRDVAGPGVSDTEVRIGIISINAATAGGSGGFEVPDQGDVDAQVAALVDHVNDNGGLAGRKIVPVIKQFESSTASPQTEAALCTAFTDDDEIFAVVLNGQRSPATRTCYKNAGTLMLETTGNAQSQQVYDENAPFYWTASAPAYDVFLDTLVRSLDAQDFFEGDVKVGIVQEKGPQYETLVENTLRPALEEAGVAEPTVGVIDQSTPDTAASTTRQVVSDFKSGKVDRVIFAGRADNAGYFTGTALPQKYFPRLAISTYEDPQFSALNPAFFPAEALEGALGIGTTPTKDFVQDLEWPFSDAEKACLDIYEAADITFDARRNTGDAMKTCDAFLFMAAAAGAVADGDALNATTFQEAAFGLGDSWQAANNFGTTFADGVHAPTNAYRELAYVDGEFVYTSEVKQFPGR